MISANKYSTNTSLTQDQKLWEALRAGNHQAYATIYNQQINSLYAYGKKLCSNTAKVEDAIQDVFIDLWRYKGNLGTVRSIAAYLITCLRRQLLKNINKERILVFDDAHLPEDHFEFEFSAQDLMIQAQDQQREMERIRKALNLLTPRQKEIIYLKYFQGLSYEEIGNMMNLNHRSTYNLVSKALATLRDKLVIFIILFLIG